MSDNKKIRSISEGYFHSVQASNKAEKFKLSKLSQGIESCRQAQSRNYRKEEKDLLETLLKLTKQRISKEPEAEDDVLSFINGEFDGYPQSDSCRRCIVPGPRLKVTETEDDTESPFEIVPVTCQECIDEESEDVPLHRLRSELNASLKPEVSKSSEVGKGSLRSIGSQHSTKQGRGSLKQDKQSLPFRIESGATAHRVMLARGQRRPSGSSRIDLFPSRKGSVNSEVRAQQEPMKPSVDSVASYKNSKHNSLSSKSRIRSDLIPHELRARRYSVHDLEETVPFYLMRKYNHYHTNETPEEYFFNRFIKRRNALSIVEQNDIDKFRECAHGSADLGTVSFKHPDETNQLKNIDSWDDLKRRCSALCDFRDVRCNARMRTMGEDRPLAPRAPSPLLRDDSQEHEVRMPVLKKDPTDDQHEMQAARLPPYQRARSNSLPSSLLAQSFHKSKLLQQSQENELGRYGRRGSLPSNLRKIRTMPDLETIKSLKEIDNATELVDFDDADVIFPAYNPNNPNNYTLRDYRALRKCRYLRLSRLNWESLQWQAKQEALCD